MKDKLTLDQRLKHFADHQLEAGDTYGAEVLYRARARITELERIIVYTAEARRLDHENALKYLDECNARAEAHETTPATKER